jgi:ankyrin repeat protein
MLNIKKSMKASEYGHDKIVDILIKEGIDVNVKTDYGSTALHKGLYKMKLKH